MEIQSLFIPAAVLAVTLTGGLTSCSVVDAGEVGVLKHLGAVQPKPLSEGVHFTRPFGLSSVERYDIKMRKMTSEASASSRDMQIVRAVVEVQFSVEAALAPKVVQRFGTGDALAVTVMSAAVQETLKSVTAMYSAESLITKRSEVKTEFEKGLREFVATTLANKKIPGALNIANVAIVNFDFSQEFNEAIEAKVRAEQEALKAENEKKKRVTQAEAAAAEQKLEAEAKAYQIELESKARAEAIERESKALKANPELIQLRIAEKWDGQLPKFTGDKIPMLRMD